MGGSQIMKLFSGTGAWGITIIIGGLLLGGCGGADLLGTPANSSMKPSPAGDSNQLTSVLLPYVQEVIATGLDVPWEIEVAPDGRVFVTERTGALRVIENGKLVKEPVYSFEEGLYKRSEAGVLGFALDPSFAQNHYIYVYQSYIDQGEPQNRLVRLVEQSNKAKLDKVIFDGLPAYQNHDGGRVKFGPDGMLYLTNGDAGSPSISQDQQSLGGKIFRIKPDGSIPEDNPFPGSPVYSLGHRNPQGLAWHPITKQLYSSEHGQSAHDEINLITAGANYGWPLVQGDEKELKAADASKKGPGQLQAPIIHSGETTWAPSGITFVKKGPWENQLLVANLRGTQLQRMVLAADGKSVHSIETLFKGELGRLRSVIEGPDGSIYILTNNRDGRGTPKELDDQIIRLKPPY
jgi:glucose/arabinose dehydrogenase